MVVLTVPMVGPLETEPELEPPPQAAKKITDAASVSVAITTRSFSILI
jgi:hypothetical protein